LRWHVTNSRASTRLFSCASFQIPTINSCRAAGQRLPYSSQVAVNTSALQSPPLPIFLFLKRLQVALPDALGFRDMAEDLQLLCPVAWTRRWNPHPYRISRWPH